MFAPALNKTPLVKWERGHCFVSSTHSLLPRALNVFALPEQGSTAAERGLDAGTAIAVGVGLGVDTGAIKTEANVQANSAAGALAGALFGGSGAPPGKK